MAKQTVRNFSTKSRAATERLKLIDPTTVPQKGAVVGFYSLFGEYIR